jgi:hypothetical protein
MEEKNSKETVVGGGAVRVSTSATVIVRRAIQKAAAVKVPFLPYGKGRMDKSIALGTKERRCDEKWTAEGKRRFFSIVY